MIELPRDANGCVIPLDTKVLYDECGNELKVLTNYADAIVNGTKTFEICKNDRGFKVGDKIVFEVLANEGYDVREAARHPLNGAVYRIDYILDGFDGLAQKYVALSISREDDHER